MPTPISRMKKAECVREIERLKGLHHVESSKVQEVLKTAETPKPVAKKVKAVQEAEHAKQADTVKKTKSVKASASVQVPTLTEDKPKKGSEEMKARMAALRAKRVKKE